jgi:signal transduction histidine kinase
MRISYKVGLVGGIPIAIAAAIALFAWALLHEVERARTGAVLAGAVYRNLLSVANARDAYVNPLSTDRDREAARFYGFQAQARRDLDRLAVLARDPRQKSTTAGASEALGRYAAYMEKLIEVTALNNRLITEMDSRAVSLIALTDQARDRQHASNTDLVASLGEQDRKLRSTRAVVDGAQELRVALAVAEQKRAELAQAQDAERRRALDFALIRVRNAASSLEEVLRTSERVKDADQLTPLAAAYASTPPDPSPAAVPGTASLPGDAADAARKLAAWCDRLLKINTTEQRALHDEAAQMLTYSVEAGETEQATQNIAITTLKLGQRTVDALARRKPDATASILGESKALAATVGSLPISPLIQAEMADALDQWRDALATTTAGLTKQNNMIGEMDVIADTMISHARALNDLFSQDAERIGEFIRNLLMFGAAGGLLVGAATGLLVARSITQPLRRLQRGMMELAADPHGGSISDFGRNDELGDIARAANFFVTEIGRREQALRRAKDRADMALAELKRTQTELIQAEKLASLGQLVAGVAHEINTPLGIALTTATTLGDAVKRFSGNVQNGQLSRSEFVRLLDRMAEGSRLLFTNLTRAASLVQSFKQVSADQASGERRRFEVSAWLNDLMTSLGPALRKTGPDIVVDCRADYFVDTYPGALAQVLTNLVMNALAHAFDPGKSGRLMVSVSQPRSDALRIVVADDGKGIPAENLSKVFDPFFTTGRSRGSTGLGLHIVYNLVTVRLQGKIELDSRPGAGTRFTIDLPASLGETTSERHLASV